MTDEKKKSWRDLVRDVVLVANLFAFLTVIFGGMNYFQTVHANQTIQTKALEEVTAEIKEIQHWRHEHDKEVAGYRDLIDRVRTDLNRRGR